VGTASRRYHLESCVTAAFSQATDDMMCFYTTVIRLVLEYMCPAWHSSLTAAQAKSLKSIQRQAMRVIFQDDDYMLLMILAGVDTHGFY